MIIQQTALSKYSFYQAFKDYDRAGQFSMAGFDALFEHLEQLTDEWGYDYILDVIELCCEYTEYDSIDEYNADYDTEYEIWEDCEHLVALAGEHGAIVNESYR